MACVTFGLQLTGVSDDTLWFGAFAEPKLESAFQDRLAAGAPKKIIVLGVGFAAWSALFEVACSYQDKRWRFPAVAQLAWLCLCLLIPCLTAVAQLLRARDQRRNSLGRAKKDIDQNRFSDQNTEIGSQSSSDTFVSDRLPVHSSRVPARVALFFFSIFGVLLVNRIQMLDSAQKDVSLLAACSFATLIVQVALCTGILPCLIPLPMVAFTTWILLHSTDPTKGVILWVCLLLNAYVWSVREPQMRADWLIKSNVESRSC